MTEIIKETLTSKNNGVPIASSVEKQLIKIQGTLTSQIQLKGEDSKEPYYYSFIRLKGQSVDLPVIFKIEDDQLSKPELKKNDGVELSGNYSISPNRIRKSFTAYSYQLLNEKQIRKKCSECDDSGLIKFPNQPPRSCKLCYLTQPKEEKNIFAK